jgi:hypothetical protein
MRVNIRREMHRLCIVILVIYAGWLALDILQGMARSSEQTGWWRGLSAGRSGAMSGSATRQ